VATSPEIDSLARLRTELLFLFLTRSEMLVNRTNCGFPPDVFTFVCSSYCVTAVDMLCKKQESHEM